MELVQLLLKKKQKTTRGNNIVDLQQVVQKNLQLY